MLSFPITNRLRARLHNASASMLQLRNDANNFVLIENNESHLKIGCNPILE